MNTFTLLLQDETHAEMIEGVSSFVGEDISGSFGILAGHMRMMTTLVMGLARYRKGSEPWQYLAQPGAVLYFRNNLLTISTRHFFHDLRVGLVAQFRYDFISLYGGDRNRCPPFYRFRSDNTYLLEANG